MITSLICESFPLCNKLYSIFKTASFCWLLIFSLIFSMLLTSLHLLKQSDKLEWRFLNSWIKAFSFNKLSLLSTKALSVTDLIAKLSPLKMLVTYLHSFIILVFSVIVNHLLKSLFCPPAVVLINWITALFLNAWPYSNSFLNGANDPLKVFSTNKLKPFSNLVAFK